MKKILKMLTSIILAVLTFANIVFVSYAAEDTTHATGLMDMSFSAMTGMYDGNNDLLYAFADYRLGDLNKDGKITALDARLCLRVSAKLDVLNYKDSQIADVNDDNNITSADARMILRSSAQIEKLPAKIYNDFPDVSYTVALNGSPNQYFWQCVTDTENVNVKEYRVSDSDPEILGKPADVFFVFAAKNEGEFKVRFILANAAQNNIQDEFEVIVKA